MTNNEAVRWIEVDREQYFNERTNTQDRLMWYRRALHLVCGFDAEKVRAAMAEAEGVTLKDCASHAKAKGVPVVDVEKEREAIKAAIEAIKRRPISIHRDYAEEDADERNLVTLAAMLARAESSKAVPAEGRRVEEPVAWLVRWADGEIELTDNAEIVDNYKIAVERSGAQLTITPLYTGPAIAEGFVAVPRASVAFAAGALDGMGKSNPNKEAQQHADALLAALSADSGRGHDPQP